MTMHHMECISCNFATRIWLTWEEDIPSSPSAQAVLPLNSTACTVLILTSSACILPLVRAQCPLYVLCAHGAPLNLSCGNCMWPLYGAHGAPIHFYTLVFLFCSFTPRFASPFSSSTQFLVGSDEFTLHCY